VPLEEKVRLKYLCPVRIENSTITNNTTALSKLNGGRIVSFGKTPSRATSTAPCRSSFRSSDGRPITCPGSGGGWADNAEGLRTQDGGRLISFGNNAIEGNGSSAAPETRPLE
jgi:hypothetical protein